MVLDRSNSFAEFYDKTNQSLETKYQGYPESKKELFDQMNKRDLPRVAFRFFVFFVVINAVCNVPLQMGNYAGSFLWFGNLAQKSSSFVETMLAPILVGYMTKVVDDHEDPDMRANIKDRGLNGQLKR